MVPKVGRVVPAATPHTPPFDPQRLTRDELIEAMLEASLALRYISLSTGFATIHFGSRVAA